ncbi:MAG: Prevent-host-death family protein [Candidatus Gottesmanbacteria bacterium GW2011_GWA2_41_12]|uniref:Antitoxin n=2 Tax=Candidatus Gottesmaniibacteriota TaxID=1752720 RepID=A0A0G0XL66_9BACT|nr:MAG: Prevent-host-death family protein [Candidatus Gottesmanbacteria bacterium GW2011_GWC2_39_8]KKR88452.1 MAG: Prevent-host-death family protein [Candidatus Gottesmanbacteria bacterium GW2011_GWA2_41_12]
MTKTISAYDARTNFGEILNEVYYKNEEVIVTKTGKPMVKIVRAPGETPKEDFESIWQDFQKLAREGKQIDLVEFVRKDRDSGHKLNY